MLFKVKTNRRRHTYDIFSEIYDHVMISSFKIRKRIMGIYKIK